MITNVFYIKKVSRYMKNDLDRFIEAQKNTYNRALQEIKNGKKESHWIWYIFPQIRGLGHSERANYYAIEDIEEATNYLKNPILYARLIEISKALLEVEEKTAIEILGYVDAMKVKSSMTLFHLANSEEKTYIEVLNKYYQGEKDEKTIQLLQKNYQYQQNRKNII